MAAIERFEDIQAWRIARDLTVRVYEASREGAFARDFGLRDQITRAAASIMHNIAEGFDAESNGDFLRFLGYAKRSCTEVQSQLCVALDQQYLDQPAFASLYATAGEARATIIGFIKYLRTSNYKKHTTHKS